jgi:hypothetical protein
MRHCSVGTERPVPVVHALRVAAALRRGKHHSRAPFNVGGCKESRRVRGWTARRAAPVRYLAPRIHSRRGRLPSSRLRRRAEAHQLKTLPALLAPGADPPSASLSTSAYGYSPPHARAPARRHTEGGRSTFPRFLLGRLRSALTQHHPRVPATAAPAAANGAPTVVQ